MARTRSSVCSAFGRTSLATDLLEWPIRDKKKQIVLMDFLSTLPLLFPEVEGAFVACSDSWELVCKVSGWRAFSDSLIVTDGKDNNDNNNNNNKIKASCYYKQNGKESVKIKVRKKKENFSIDIRVEQNYGISAFNRRWCNTHSEDEPSIIHMNPEEGEEMCITSLITVTVTVTVIV